MKFSLAAILALMLVPQVQAASVSVTMNQTDVDVLPDGIDYLQVTISDGIDGAIDFAVNILSALTDINMGSNFGIEDFTLNLGASAATAANFLLPNDWVARQFEPPAGQFKDFGLFDIHLKGGPSTRQQPLEFSIVDVEGDTIFDYVSQLSGGFAAQGNVLFAAKLAGFEPDIEALQNSPLGQLLLENQLNPEDIPGFGKFGGPTSVVPLPPAVLLSLSAMAMLGVAGIRRRKALGAE